MHNSTETLIEGIADLFEEDLKASLEYTRGTRKMTIQKQLINRFGDMYPRYTLERSLDLASDIIQRNLRSIYNIGKEVKFMRSLSNPDSFSKVSNTDNSDDKSNKTLSLSNKQDARETIGRTKQRGGAATRSFDNIGEEGIWDEEDNQTSLSSVALNFKTVTTDNVKDAKIIQSFSESIKDPNYNLEPKESIKRDKKTEEGRYLNTLEVTTARNKVFNKQIQSILGHSDNYSQEKRTTRQTTKIEAINILNVLNTDVTDLRDRFFNQFYELFDYYPQTCL